MHIGLYVKYPSFMSDLKKKLILSTDFRKIQKYQISQKSIQWEPICSMRTEGDGRTAMSNLTAAFGNFAKNA